MPDVIIVLGMHRSGTSSVAGVLTELGGAAPRTLMPPNEENAKGYFESMALMHFHDHLLASAGSNWRDWRRFDRSWRHSPAAAVYKERAKQTFDVEFEGAALPVLKDPRICRFAPFWIDVLKEMGRTPRIVIPIRSPLEVARSLKKSQGVAITAGMLLWLRHMLDAEGDTRDAPRSVFDWDEFRSDWRRIAAQISSDTGLSWPQLSDRSHRSIEEFLDAGLVHQKVDHSELIAHSDVHEWTIVAYEALLELARNPLSDPAVDKLNEIRELFERACAMFGPAFADYEAGLKELRAESSTVRGERDLLRRQAAETGAALDNLRDVRDRLTAEAQQRESGLREAIARQTDLTSDLDQVRAALESKARALRDADAREANLRRLLDHATVERLSLESQKETLSTQLTMHAAQHASLLAETERAVQAAQADRSRLEEADRLRLAAAESEAALKADLAQSRAAHDSARGQVETLEMALAAAKREQQISAYMLAATRTKLGATFRSANDEKERLMAEIARQAVAFRRARQRDADRVAAMEAAHAVAFMESENRAQAQAGNLRDQLVDTEAALAKAKSQARKGAIFGRWAPAAGRARAAERDLIKSGLFDADWYRSEYPDVAGSGRTPAAHFLEEGYLRGYRPNPLFDTRWYLARYEDVRRSGMNPAVHYARYGAPEGRDPGPDFQTSSYLVAYPDVRSSGMNPLAHFLRHGKAEGRLGARPKS